MTSNVCFVDTETTGLDPDRHPIWNVGLIHPDGWEREWFLPVDLSTADSFALNVGHYQDRHPWGEGTSYRNFDDRPKVTQVADFAREFMRFTWGHHLAGAVVSFDEERLRRLLRANGACPGWHYHLIDVEALAAGYLAGQRTPFVLADGTEVPYNPQANPPWDSALLSRSVGVNPDDFDRHTALGDARWAKAIYEAVTGP